MCFALNAWPVMIAGSLWSSKNSQSLCQILYFRNQLHRVNSQRLAANSAQSCKLGIIKKCLSKIIYQLVLVELVGNISCGVASAAAVAKTLESTEKILISRNVRIQQILSVLLKKCLISVPFFQRVFSWVGKGNLLGLNQISSTTSNTFSVGLEVC